MEDEGQPGRACQGESDRMQASIMQKVNEFSSFTFRSANDDPVR